MLQRLINYLRGTSNAVRSAIIVAVLFTTFYAILVQQHFFNSPTTLFGNSFTIAESSALAEWFSGIAAIISILTAVVIFIHEDRKRTEEKLNEEIRQEKTRRETEAFSVGIGVYWIREDDNLKMSCRIHNGGRRPISEVLIKTQNANFAISKWEMQLPEHLKRKWNISYSHSRDDEFIPQEGPIKASTLLVFNEEVDLGLTLSTQNKNSEPSGYIIIEWVDGYGESRKRTVSISDEPELPEVYSSIQVF